MVTSIFMTFMSKTDHLLERPLRRLPPLYLAAQQLSTVLHISTCSLCDLHLKNPQHKSLMAGRGVLYGFGEVSEMCLIYKSNVPIQSLVRNATIIENHTSRSFQLTTSACSFITCTYTSTPPAPNYHPRSAR